MPTTPDTEAARAMVSIYAGVDRALNATFVNLSLPMAMRSIINSETDKLAARMDCEDKKARAWVKTGIKLEIEMNIAILNDVRAAYRDVF